MLPSVYKEAGIVAKIADEIQLSDPTITRLEAVKQAMLKRKEEKNETS